MKGAVMFAALLCLWCGPALAEPPSSLESAAIEEMFSVSGREMNLPVGLLKAIAAVESEMNPWAVNVAGRGYYFKTKAEAVNKAEKAQRAGLSYDVGLMQVNRWWLRRQGLNLEEALDPATNIALGAWILRQELNRLGSVRAAVGAYHSPNPRRAGRYADKVMRVFQAESSVQQSAVGDDGQVPAPAWKNESMKAETPASGSMKVSK